MVVTFVLRRSVEKEDGREGGSVEKEKGREGRAKRSTDDVRDAF